MDGGLLSSLEWRLPVPQRICRRDSQIADSVGANLGFVAMLKPHGFERHTLDFQAAGGLGTITRGVAKRQWRGQFDE